MSKAVVMIFEGVDLCGKSTLIREVQKQLLENGKTCKIVPAVDKSVPGVEFLAKGLRDKNLPKLDRIALYSEIHKLVVAHIRVIADHYDFLLLDRSIYSFFIYNLNGMSDTDQIRIVKPLLGLYRGLDTNLVCIDMHHDDYLERLKTTTRKVDWTDIHTKERYQQIVVDYLRLGIWEHAKFIMGGVDDTHCPQMAENLLKEIVYENGYKFRQKDDIIKKLS